MIMEVIYVTHNVSKLRKGDTFISVKISFEAYRISMWVIRFRVINFDLRWKNTFQHLFSFFICTVCYLDIQLYDDI